MEFIHQFCESGWGNAMHQLVVILDDGTRLESGFIGYQGAAVLDDPSHDGCGWIAFTDYYDGVMPSLSTFGPVTAQVKTESVDPKAVFPDMPVVESADDDEEGEANDEEFCLRESPPKSLDAVHKNALDRARSAGESAWCAGVPYDGCPHYEPDLRDEWNAGWNAACRKGNNRRTLVNKDQS